jgi:hypothetical protein
VKFSSFELYSASGKGLWLAEIVGTVSKQGRGLGDKREGTGEG